MAYRKLGVDNKHRRSMLANLTKDLIMNESINTTDARAKEVRKMFGREPRNGYSHYRRCRVRGQESDSCSGMHPGWKRPDAPRSGDWTAVSV